MIRLLALSGSLRARSSNGALLEAAALLAPAGMRIEPFAGIGALPHFNPDLEAGALPDAVRALRERVGAADGLLISCPEYARGIPGSFKNALDWLVGGPEFRASRSRCSTPRRALPTRRRRCAWCCARCPAGLWRKPR